MKPLDIVADPGRSVADRGLPSPQVDIVVPVKDEEGDLARSVRRLCSFLRGQFPFTARITIADNGCTDKTWAMATASSREFPGVTAVHMEQPGAEVDERVGGYYRAATPPERQRAVAPKAALLSRASSLATVSRDSLCSRPTFSS